MDGEATPPKQRGLLEPWKPGQSGNPKGRPKGARGKLGEDFLSDLYEHWQGNGPVAIATVFKERPHEYLKVVASLLPKQVEIKDSTFEDVSPEQLAALIVAARSALGLADGSGEGISATQGPQSVN